MLPNNALTGGTRRAWVIFLLLSPLAYAAGILLLVKHDPSVQAGLRVDRQQALAIASQFAATKGLNVAGWDSFCIANEKNDLHFYYRLLPAADRDHARRLAPEVIVKVLLRNPDRSETVEVELGTDGTPRGLTRNLPANRAAPDPGEAATRRMAEAALRARPEAIEIPPNAAPTLSETTDSGAVTRKYTWPLALASRPELKVRYTTSVRGDTLLEDRVGASLDSGFAKKNLGGKRVIKIVSQIFYWLAITLVVIFGIYRFVQRARQKEVSYSRIFLLAFLFALVLDSFVILTDLVIFDIAATPNAAVPEWIIYFSAGMFWLLMGLFVGLAYGSGEGDIREGYPGKLTSLDALITGKVFSRNVARALVVGCAIGGWIMMINNFVVSLWSGRPNAGEEYRTFSVFLMRFPLIGTVIGWPMDMILILVIGLLLPLPFLQRRLKSQRMILLFLALFVWVACQGFYLNFRPWTIVLMMAAVKTTFLLLAFFQFDLLTAAFSISTSVYTTFVVTLAAQPAPGLRQAGITSIIITLAVLVTEFICAWRGRLYSDDEVRPVYAKNLAERLALKAEVSAAREAQVRLLPNRLPLTSHFSVAASCLPAHEVGGDFYDFFELDHGKLGVLIAEGGGRGLGAALSIAFAKGFVMPKILGQTGADDSPAEVLRGLQDRLTRMLDQDEVIGLAYAVIDTSDGTLRYARTGAYPRVLVSQGADRSRQAERLLAPEERELRFRSSQPAAADITVIEGQSLLAAGDSVVLFTDGIAKTWAEDKRSPESELAKVLAEGRPGSTHHLQEALMKTVNDGLKRARKHGLEDDLTAVVVRVEQPAATAVREGQ